MPAYRDAATERDVDSALRAIKHARGRARSAADAIQGIPIYLSMWGALFSIENALREAERSLGGETRD